MPYSVDGSIKRIVVVLIAIFALACGGAAEGEVAGDCTDRADNDGDGAFDCDDSGCAGSPDCAGMCSVPTRITFGEERLVSGDCSGVAGALEGRAISIAQSGTTLTLTDPEGNPSACTLNASCQCIAMSGTTVTLEFDFSAGSVRVMTDACVLEADF